ncbi:MAG: four helix bundle protein [candidate division Zixibacteria bacterium]|nr:four helix bundle protein [candidate division Zixibacteria bacterium]
MKANIKSFEDLDVYKKLCELHLKISEVSLKFPKFELYELGSQIRRSSNSIPANIAEGWNNKHTNIYLESINRAQGELQETKHHLYIAYRKKYLSEEIYREYFEKCNECGRMLRGLEQSLLKWKSKT